MAADGTGAGGSGQAGGLPDDPRWLAAGAAGLVSACLAVWAFRGLPLGAFAFWAASLPLFLAGIGFGSAAALGAVAVAAAAIWLVGSTAGLWLWLLAFGLPAALLVGFAGRGLGAPLALLGLMPAAGIAGAAIWLADTPGGLEGTLEALARSGLQRFDLASSGGLVSDIVRVKAAAIGFWLSLALLANAWAAGAILSRAGLSAAPGWSAARLPGAYVALPALAFGLWLAADEGEDALELSLFLVLMVPLMLHGLAVLHTRTQGMGIRPLLLGGLYVSLVVLFLPASIAVAGYGAFDLLVRPSSSNKGGGRGTAPPAPHS